MKVMDKCQSNSNKEISNSKNNSHTSVTKGFSPTHNPQGRKRDGNSCKTQGSLKNSGENIKENNRHSKRIQEKSPKKDLEKHHEIGKRASSITETFLLEKNADVKSKKTPDVAAVENSIKSVPHFTKTSSERPVMRNQSEIRTDLNLSDSEEEMEKDNKINPTRLSTESLNDNVKHIEIKENRKRKTSIQKKKKTTSKVKKKSKIRSDKSKSDSDSSSNYSTSDLEFTSSDNESINNEPKSSRKSNIKQDTDKKIETPIIESCVEGKQNKKHIDRTNEIEMEKNADDFDVDEHPNSHLQPCEEEKESNVSLTAIFDFYNIQNVLSPLGMTPASSLVISYKHFFKYILVFSKLNFFIDYNYIYNYR